MILDDSFASFDSSKIGAHQRLNLIRFFVLCRPILWDVFGFVKLDPSTRRRYGSFKRHGWR